MAWQCYGWDGNFCHTGSNFFASDKDGLCFKDTDMDYVPNQYPFTLYFGVLNQPSYSRLNRKIVAFFNGDAFDTLEMNNSWNYIWYALDFAGKQNDGLYTFQLQDGDGHVLCEKSSNIGEETATPSPELPAKEDYTDYTKISNIVKNSNNLLTLTVSTDYKTLETGLGAINTGLSHQVASSKSEVETKLKVVDDRVKNLSTSFEDKFNLDDGTIVSYLNDIKHDVDNINFPDLSGLSDSVDDLKDSIGNITFPDLSGLSNTLDNVKSTLENLDIPSLGQISQLTNKVATAVNDIYTHIYQDLVRERNNIFSHIDVKITNLETDIKNKIDDIDITVPDITFPDLSFITDGFTSVETKIEGLKFPSIDDIENGIVNAAETIAEKILEKLLDAIEGRYNK